MAGRVETLQSQQVQLGVWVVSDLMDNLGNDREKRLQESDKTTKAQAIPALGGKYEDARNKNLKTNRTDCTTRWGGSPLALLRRCF